MSCGCVKALNLTSITVQTSYVTNSDFGLVILLIAPSNNSTTRSARPARSRLCVTMINVWPCRLLKFHNSSCRLSLDSRSRFPDGSSARTNSGSFINARATATRCCSPPESSPGRCMARCPRSTSVKSCMARRDTSRVLRPAISAGIITFSSALNSGSK